MKKKIFFGICDTRGNPDGAHYFLNGRRVTTEEYYEDWNFNLNWHEYYLSSGFALAIWEREI